MIRYFKMDGLFLQELLFIERKIKMTKIYDSIDQLIGRTPLVRLKETREKDQRTGNILLKLEHFNPAGSVKDRIGKAMIDAAEESGKLKAGGTIIEATSGNTGIGLASVASSRGYDIILTMPETMSVERQKILKAYGAKIELTDGEEGMNGSIAKAIELAETIPNSFIPSQFENKVNPKIHYQTTGPEIYQDTEGQVDIFVAGIGTGGTITGTGKYLKEQNPDIQIVAVEPTGSPILSEGEKGKHAIQGIGAGFIPSILDTNIYDEVITIDDELAYSTARNLGKTDGIFVGVSAGAALAAAKKVANRPENKGKTIVVIMPDGGERYLSLERFI